MEAKELRNFNVDELKTRVRQWRDELFRAKFKAESTEARDTSTFKKLRRDIARALTILNEKTRTGAVEAKAEAKVASAPVETAEDKPVDRPAKKKTTARKPSKAKE